MRLSLYSRAKLLYFYKTKWRITYQLKGIALFWTWKKLEMAYSGRKEIFSLHHSPLQRENEAKVVLSREKKVALQSNAGWEGVIRLKMTLLRSDSQFEVTL